MRHRRRVDQTDYSSRVAATKLRIARERLGIPVLEAELKRMLQVNNTARMTGEPDVFDENVISAARAQLRILESEVQVSR